MGEQDIMSINTIVSEIGLATRNTDQANTFEAIALEVTPIRITGNDTGNGIVCRDSSGAEISSGFNTSTPLGENQFRITSWNVNSVKTLMCYHPWNSLSFDKVLSQLGDIVCFQEIKSTKMKLEQRFHTIPGWYAFYCLHQTEGYAGVATYCKRELCPIQSEEGFSGLCSTSNIGGLEELYKEFSIQELRELDSEGRCVITDHGKFVLFNVYFPAFTAKVRLLENFKLRCLIYLPRFSQAIQTRANSLKLLGRNVILVGDFNVVHQPIDVFDTTRRVIEGGMEYSLEADQTRTWFASLLVDHIDTFRHLHKNPHVYTFWLLQQNLRPQNQGSRIDYILLPKSMESSLVAAEVWGFVKGSDHCPVTVVLEGMFLGGKVFKGLGGCSVFWDGYGDRQPSIISFFAKKSEGGMEGGLTVKKEGKVRGPNISLMNGKTTDDSTKKDPAGLLARREGVRDVKVVKSKKKTEKGLKPIKDFFKAK